MCGWGRPRFQQDDDILTPEIESKAISNRLDKIVFLSIFGDLQKNKASNSIANWIAKIALA
jgi:hypothetical protein